MKAEMRRTQYIVVIVTAQGDLNAHFAGLERQYDLHTFQTLQRGTRLVWKRKQWWRRVLS